MQWNPWIAVASIGVALALTFTVAAYSSESAASNSDPVARGKYLVTAFGCADCHSPWILGSNGPGPDPERFLAGYPAGMSLPPAPEPRGPWIVSAAATNTAWAGPWGTSFTANLTPDAETGLGAWSADDFVATLRTGRHLGRGRQLLPPMPTGPLGTLGDDDLRAMFAFLKSIPAIQNRVPDPLPPAQE